MTEDGRLVQLAELANAQRDAEVLVEKYEEQLKKAKQGLRKISEDKLPTLMDELDMTTFSTKSGLTVTIKESIRASITKANNPAAMAWLRENGHEKLIKHEVKIQPANEKEAAALTKKLAKVSYVDTTSVHSQTLAKFVREKMEAGEDIPQDLFGVFRQRISKVQV